MENYSRVKKYEQLRKEIDMGVEEEIKSEELSSYANRLNEFDPMFFKKMEVQSEPQPMRMKENTDVLPTKEEPFKNEYMDDFIREVKAYNKEKGLIESEITEIDILNQLKNPVRLKRENYVRELTGPQPIIKPQEKNGTNETIQQSKMEIARQIQELLNDEEQNSGMNVNKVEIEETKPIQEDHSHEFMEKINEQTQQIRIQMDQQSNDLKELNTDLDKTNRLLNIVLVIVLIALLGLIAFMVYWMITGGINV